MNTRQLIDYIHSVVDSIEIVHSFSDTDPYTFWNSQEVKYGSVVFAVKGYTILNGVTRYQCVLYYGDRLLEDESNVNDLYTDTQMVINHILKNIDFSDGTLQVTTNTPSVTFFTQGFLDKLAGGYCNFSIDTDDSLGACGYNEGKIINPD